MDAIASGLFRRLSTLAASIESYPRTTVFNKHRYRENQISKSTNTTTCTHTRDNGEQHSLVSLFGPATTGRVHIVQYRWNRGHDICGFERIYGRDGLESRQAVGEGVCIIRGSNSGALRTYVSYDGMLAFRSSLFSVDLSKRQGLVGLRDIVVFAVSPSACACVSLLCVPPRACFAPRVGVC